MNGLVGYTGFVGSNLLFQGRYDALFNSANAHELRGRSFDRLVFASAYAEKWKANKDPEGDRKHIQALMNLLASVQVREMILISTIDVYPQTRDRDEESGPSPEEENHPYGHHRLLLETFVRERFPDSTVVRLSGLFGPGIRKNAIFDLLHRHRLEWVPLDGVFQFYDLQWLGSDLERTLAAGLRVVNLFPEPVSIREIRDAFFPGTEVGSRGSQVPRYDLRTRYCSHFRGPEGYVASRAQVMRALGRFFAFEQQRNG